MTIAGHSICSSACRSANGAERGTRCSASATASRCSCTAIRWRSARPTVVAPLLRDALHAERLGEAPRSRRSRSASLSASQRASRCGPRVLDRVEAGRDRDEPRHALGLLEREAQARVRAHRDARQHGARRSRARRARPRGRGQRVVAVGVRSVGPASTSRGRARRRRRRGGRRAAARASPSRRSAAPRSGRAAARPRAPPPGRRATARRTPPPAVDHALRHARKPGRPACLPCHA